MPFREKKAWITLLSLTSVSLLFVFMMERAFNAGDTGLLGTSQLIFIGLVVFVVVESGLLLLARWQSGEDARMPKDERELAFDLKATRVAYIVLILLLLLVTLLMLYWGGSSIAWGLHYLLAIVVAEMGRAAAQIVYFRKNA